MSTKIKTNKLKLGQSVIELVLAIGIFAIIASASVVSILGAYRTNILAEQETKAVFLASEGLEAVKSIRNQSWANLASGTYGLTNTNGYWEFQGTSDVNDGFTRVIEIADVQRDATGAVVDLGGDVDDDTKLITSTVSWDPSPTRNNSVDVSLLLTNHRESGETPGGASPDITLCSDYCSSLGFSTGTCRANINQCANNSETYKPQGNIYCTSGPSADTCCCLP